jgi:hypothetical protein
MPGSWQLIDGVVVVAAVGLIVVVLRYFLGAPRQGDA